MAERIFEYLGNLLKIGKEQFIAKSNLLKNKVPIKPLLGLTGLGVLLIAAGPLLSNKNSSEEEVETTISFIDKPGTEGQYSIQKTLYLMKEKEKLLRKQETASLQKS